MDPYDSPLRVPYSSTYNPLPHSLLRTRQLCAKDVGFLAAQDFGFGLKGLGLRV